MYIATVATTFCSQPRALIRISQYSAFGLMSISHRSPRALPWLISISLDALSSSDNKLMTT
jgi:hypothetical protein